MKSLLLRLGALFILATGASFVASTLITDSTHAAPLTNTNVSQQVYQQLSQFAADPAQEPDEGEEDKPETSCIITGVGWIVCPIVRFMAEIVDASYGYVRSLLVVQPLLTTGNSAPAYQAWEMMRNFANVAFVIAFLIIIFSQVTSVGVSNYGIKRLLPRIIVAAILVNVSFWVCAIAVDLSNIAGSSVNGLFDSIRADLARQPDPNQNNPFSTGEGWAGAAGVALSGGLVIAGAAAGLVSISALIPSIIIAVIAIVTVFLVLVIRQALIILLVIASPLAFVAYLLPNTESMFEKWRSLFQTLLLMFPIIAGIFGASALASFIVMRSATGDYAIIIQIAGAFVAIAPLALTPLVMKTAGSLLGRISNIATRPVNSMGDKAKGYAKPYMDRRDAINRARRLKGTNMTKALGERIKARGDAANNGRRSVRGVLGGALIGASAPGIRMSGAMQKRKVDEEQRNVNASKALGEATQDYVSESILDKANGAEYAQSIAGPTGDVGAVRASAVAVQRASMGEDVKNAQRLIQAEIGPGNVDVLAQKLSEAIRAGDEIQAQAYQNQLFASGGEGLKQYRNTMNSIGADPNADELLNNKASQEMRRNFVDNHAALKAKAADFMQQANGVAVKDENGNAVMNEDGSVKKDYNMATATAQSGAWGMSDAEMSGQKGASLEAAQKAGAFSGSPEDIKHFGMQAERVLNTPQLAGNMDATNRKVLEGLRDAAKQGMAEGMAQGAAQATSQTGTLQVPHNNPPQAPPVPQPQQRPANPNFQGTTNHLNNMSNNANNNRQP